MKALDFYRYLRGYVTVYISGGFIERFINLCNKNQINLWDVNFEGNSVKANVYCKDFFLLKPICRKSGVRIKILIKNGLSFDLKSQKKRRGLLIGFVFAAVFMLTMNLFVWEIEIIGSDRLSKEEILSTVKNVGLHYGTFSPLFDSGESARKAVNLFNGKVLWLAINIKGSKATVEVRDLEQSAENDIKTEPSNLMANFDGTLIQTQTHSGVQIVNPGESVTKGEILISGIFENEDGSVMYQRSNGDFTAYHERIFQKKYKTVVPFASIADTGSVRSFNFFHLNIPLSFIAKKNFDEIQSYTKQLAFDGKMLPFGLTENIIIKSKTEIENNINSLYFIDRFTSDEYENMKNTLVVDSEYKVTNLEESVNISGTYKCIDYIGKEVPIIRENSNF